MARTYRKEGTYSTKVCIDCGLDKPTGDYQVSTYRKTGKSILSSYCKTCKNKRTIVNNYKRRYNLSASEVEDLRKRFPVCAICGSDVHLDIDHNHETGEVRGILCHNCNSGIGHFKENPEKLLQAVEYLKFFKKEIPAVTPAS